MHGVCIGSRVVYDSCCVYSSSVNLPGKQKHRSPVPAGEGEAGNATQRVHCSANPAMFQPYWTIAMLPGVGQSIPHTRTPCPKCTPVPWPGASGTFSPSCWTHVCAGSQSQATRRDVIPLCPTPHHARCLDTPRSAHQYSVLVSPKISAKGSPRPRKSMLRCRDESPKTPPWAPGSWAHWTIHIANPLLPTTTVPNNAMHPGWYSMDSMA